MKVALLGYGKMGRAVEQVCLSKGHQVVLTADSKVADRSYGAADVAIEFSTPDTALMNIRDGLEKGVPVVVGTTGWYDNLPQVQALVAEKKGALLWASNFSIGVNLFFRVNKQLARWMDKQDGYKVKVDEVHHIHKLDTPSGTALTLVRDIDLVSSRYSGWTARPQDARSPSEDPLPVPVLSERVGEVPGRHSVSWTSPEDRVIITHEAFGRQGFAMGAVLAAEWLTDPRHRRRGVYTMDDVLDMDQ